MSYFSLPLTFLLGAALGGLFVRFWRVKGESRLFRWQKTGLVVLTAVITGLLLLGTGYAYIRYRFRPRKLAPVTTDDAVKQFRKGKGKTAKTAGLPTPGVYTFNAKGSIQIRSSLLGNADRPLPKTVPGVLVHKGNCWELTVKLDEGNENTERYCKEPGGIFMVERWTTGKMFGFTSFTRLKGDKYPIWGPTGKPGSTWKETQKLLEAKNTSPFKGKREDPQYTMTYLGEVSLTIGGKPVKAHHIKQERTFTNQMTGAMVRQLWYSVETGLLLKHVTVSSAKGMIDVDIDHTFELANLTPKR